MTSTNSCLLGAERSSVNSVYFLAELFPRNCLKDLFQELYFVLEWEPGGWGGGGMFKNLSAESSSEVRRGERRGDAVI